MKQSQFARALWYGILGALFFAFTFIFNRSMNLSGGSWMWSASLRYLFSLPMLAVLAWRKGELAGVLSAINYDSSWSALDPSLGAEGTW